MKSSVKIATAAALACNLFLASGAQAQQLPLCDFFMKLVEAGADDFSSLRGNFDFVLERYAGKLSTPSYAECHTSILGSSGRYFCRRTMHDDAAAAQTEFTAMSAKALACFTGNSQYIHRGDKYQTFKSKPHGANVTVRYQRHERNAGAIYSITLQVSARSR